MNKQASVAGTLSAAGLCDRLLERPEGHVHHRYALRKPRLDHGSTTRGVSNIDEYFRGLRVREAPGKAANLGG
jgi:hypothetical protein